MTEDKNATRGTETVEVGARLQRIDLLRLEAAKGPNESLDSFISRLANEAADNLPSPSRKSFKKSRALKIAETEDGAG